MSTLLVKTGQPSMYESNRRDMSFVFNNCAPVSTCLPDQRTRKCSCDAGKHQAVRWEGGGGAVPWMSELDGRQRPLMGGLMGVGGGGLSFA